MEEKWNFKTASYNWASLLSLLGSPKIRGKNAFFDDWNQFPEKQDKDGWVHWEYKHYRENGPLFSGEFLQEIDKGLKKMEQCSRENEFPLSGILQAPDGTKYTGETAKSGKNLYYRNSANKKRFPMPLVHKVVFSRPGKIVQKKGHIEMSEAFRKSAEWLLDNMGKIQPLELKNRIRDLIPRAVTRLGDEENTLELCYNLAAKKSPKLDFIQGKTQKTELGVPSQTKENKSWTSINNGGTCWTRTSDSPVMSRIL